MPAPDDAPETKPVPPPMIGSYRLVEPLGSGGMSSVFRALHKDSGHEVAVKVLPRYLAKNPTLLQRFLREAKSAESLEDPNVVAIYDRGSEAGRHYLVLEYVPGGDLHDRVREGGPLPIGEALDAVRQVARGLKHAAGRGLIHRDIKPANILRRPDGVVKLTDLGLALQVEEEEDQRVTRDGTTVGTVDYMAPEQARDSRACSVRSDIYSLGCTFYFLLTGTPPFAGGDVAEKLKAHATEPAPDARGLRPAVPPILARLVQKMMAKRPEKRFPDYATLLEALDAVAGRLDGPVPNAGPLMALIDDEDEGDDGVPATAADGLPVMALFDDDPPPKGGPPGPLMALIDEEDDESFELGPGPARSAGSTISTPTLPSSSPGRSRPPLDDLGSLANVNLSGLEGLEDESPALPSARRPPSSPGGSRPGSRPGGPPVPALAPEVAYDLEPVIAPHPHLYQVPPPDEIRTPITTWIAWFVIAGVALLVLGFSWSRFAPYLFYERPAEIVDPLLEASGGGGARPPEAGEVAAERWSEPEDANPPAPAEPPIPAEALARLGLEDAPREALARDEAPFVTVRRVDPVRDRENVGELSRAFDNLGGTVKIADDGPFFESALRIVGAVRTVRAAPGYRPIVVLGHPDSASSQSRPAAVVLDKQTLIVEGIDFVVDASALTARQESLFLLRNGSALTLRDCTVTVAGPVKHAYAVVQVGERASAANGPASTVRFERSRLRGDASALRLAGSAKATVARSAVACAGRPVVEFAGDPRSDRSVAFFRSIAAARGPIVALLGSAGSADAAPPKVRSFESTFAAIAADVAPPPPPFVTLSDAPPGPPRPASALVDWRGESDSFAGWPSWSSTSPPGLLAGLRGERPDAERSGREAREPWPAAAADPWTAAVVPEVSSRSVAAPPIRVAAPAKSIRERTLGRFAAAPPAPGGRAGALALKFDADDEAYNGDLGKFLATARLPKGTRRLRVAVSGSGRHAMTPLAMPEGLSLEIDVAPVPAGRPPLIWTTPDDATGEALLSVRGADLAIAGAKFTATPKTALPVILAVNGGSLRVERSTLRGPFGEESAGGGLIAFRTDGTRPAPGTLGEPVACTLADCVLITGGEAITLDLGRASAAFANCAIASGSTAFVLVPQKVRRDRFEADLTLDRCTVAALDNLVWLKGWTGLAPGPDRPWVVRSSGCLFSDAFARAEQAQSRGVLLRSQVDGLARGVLAWESKGDAYDLTLFTAGGDAKPLPVARADVRRSWVDFWGPRHVEDPGGFTANGVLPPTRFLVDRLKPLELEPGDLALDPTYPPGRRALDVGADLGRMGIAPTIAKFRPR